MTWIVAALLAVVSLGLVLLFGPARKAWAAVAAALAAGLAGYALQASPGLPGAPKAGMETLADNPQALVAARRELEDKPGLPGDKWLVIGDALARNGQFADAAAVMMGAVERDPKNGEAWLAIANSLVAHADGMLTPAAMLAYQRAADANPAHPGPPFFLGLALAQSGRFADARAIWADLLSRTPAEAPWHADLKERLARLDAMMAQQEAAQKLGQAVN